MGLAACALFILSVAMTAAPSPAHAAPKAPAGSFQTLYSFCQLDSCTDGRRPEGGVVVTASGTVFGTTCYGGANADGSVFSISPSGVETVRASFDGDNGYCPAYALVAAGPNRFFGTTYEGGSNVCGYVFELVKNSGGKWVLNDLHDFGAYDGDGCYPSGGLAMDKKGNLYGFTYYGGVNHAVYCAYSGDYGCGAAFELSPPKTAKGAWTETVIYSFCSQSECIDGDYPTGSPAIDAKGTLYGSTYYGGYDEGGTAFALSPYGGEAVLYNFCQTTDCADGVYPWGGLMLDKDGNLYGTTLYGGTGYYEGYDGYGEYGGTVYKISKDGKYSVLTSLCLQTDCTDGYYPLGTLVMDKTGNLYGTAEYGGDYGCDYYGCGTVFEVLYNSSKAVLYTFSGPDGAYPVNGLTMDKKGNLYGVTTRGGSENEGTVFVLRR